MQWQGKELAATEITAFFEAIGETGVYPVTVHDAYLINLANPRPEIYNPSIQAFTEELKRCARLRIPNLIMHPGSHLGSGEEQGMKRIAASIVRALNESSVSGVTILLESTAGQGSNLGYSFEQLQFIIDQSELKGEIGICLDTCHIFNAGYDLRTRKSWQTTKRKFDRIIGLEKLKCIHINDSKREIGSRVDRHARIGQGKIGLEGFRVLLNDPQLRDIPMILEIPGGEEAYREDLILLRTLMTPEKI